MNIDLLNGKIYSSGIKRIELSEWLDITPSTLRRKLTGEIEFKISEVAKICEILKLTQEEKNAIFFNK